MDRITFKNENNKKKKYKKLKILAIILTFFLLVGGSYALFLVNKASSAVKNASHNLSRGEKSKLRETAVKPLTHNVSILIMGIDENEGRQEEYNGAFHPDALLLATFNNDDKTVKLVSIPRDTYTYLPIKKRNDKITHSYAYGAVKNGDDGGPAATIDAVERLFNVPVDYFVTFNFKSFMTIVDNLGGIEVDVPVSFTEQDSNDKPDAIRIKKGLQELNGEEALALARTRKIDSDFMRGQRQQLVIEAMIKELTSMNSVTKLGTIIDDINGDFKTNLSFDDMLSFYKYGMGASMEKLQITGEDCYMGTGDKKCMPPEIHRTYYYMPHEDSLEDITDELRSHLDLPVNKSTIEEDENENEEEQKNKVVER